MIRRLGFQPILAIILLLALVIPFQNCSKNFNFTEIPSLKSSLDTDSGGNGGGYQGKPDGTFIRSLPEFTCNGSPIASTITIKQNIATLTTKNLKDCIPSTTDIKIEEVVSSEIQNQVISFKDGVYSSIEVLGVNPSPNNFDVAWCKLKNQTKMANLEALVSRAGTVYKAKIFYREAATSSIQLISSFQVNKKFNLTAIEYAASGFGLSIDVHQPIVQGAGSYSAKITTEKTGLSLNEEMVCQLSGENDGMIWPAKVLVSEKAGPTIISTDKGTVFTAFANKTGNELLRIDLLSSAISPIKNLGSAVVRDLGLSSDQKNLIIKGDLLVPNIIELFKINLANSETMRLTYDHTSSVLKTSIEPWSMLSTPNSQSNYGNNLLSVENWIVYLDSDENYNEPYFQALYAYDLNTNVRKKLTPDLNDKSFIRGFLLLPNGRLSFDMIGTFKGTNVLNPNANSYVNTYGSLDLKSGGFSSFGTDVLQPAQTGVRQSPATISYVTASRFIFGLYQVLNNDVYQAKIKLFSSKWDGSEVTEIGSLGTTSMTPNQQNESFGSLMEKNLAWKCWVHSRLLSQDQKVFVMIDKSKGWLFYNVETNQIYSIDVPSQSALVGISSFKLGTKSIYGLQFGHATGEAELVLMDEHGALFNRLKLSGQGYRVSLQALESEFYYLKPRGDGSTDLVHVDLKSLKQTLIPNSQSKVDSILKGKFSDDGLGLFFTADADNDGKLELYRLGLDGSGIVQISNRYYQFGGVTNFEVLSSNRVFFATKTLDGTEALFLWKL